MTVVQVIDLPRLSIARPSVLALGAGLALLLLSGCLSVSWCAKPEQAEVSPDVLVLVLSGIGTFDQVSINYTTEVPKEDALSDIETLARETSWPIQGRRVTVAQPSRPGARRTTSSVFQTPPLANTTDGTLPLEPFILALKRFPSIQVNYLTGSQFVFGGLKDFENDWVKITLRQSGNSYQYLVRVNKSDFEHLALPSKPGEKASEEQARGTSTGGRVMLILGLALAGAVIAYLVALFVARGRRT